MGFPSPSRPFPDNRTSTNEASVYLCFYASFTYTLLQRPPASIEEPPDRARTTPKSKLPLYETNAALAHFDRMQFSLFYSFPFCISPVQPHPSRWRVGAMKLYQNINVYVSACMNFAYLVFVCCAHEIRCAVCFNIFFSARETLYQGAEGNILASIALGSSLCTRNCSCDEMKQQILMWTTTRKKFLL